MIKPLKMIVQSVLILQFIFCTAQPSTYGQSSHGNKAQVTLLHSLDTTSFPSYKFDKSMAIELMDKETSKNNWYKTPSWLAGPEKTNEAINTYPKNARSGKAGFSNRQNCEDEVSSENPISRSDQIHQQFDKGLESQKAGRNSEACQYYEKVLQFAPNMSEAHFNLGEALLKCDKKDEALEHLEMAVQISPNDADAQSQLGMILIKCDKQIEAIKHLELAAQINPNDGGTQSYLGTALIESGKKEEALKHLEKAVQIDPKDTYTQGVLGSLFIDLGRFSEAKDHLQQAIQNDPTDAQIRVNLGMVYMKLRDVDQAEQQFEEAIKLDSKCSEAWLDLGTLKMETGDLAGAISYFKEYVSRFPSTKETPIVQSQISSLEKELAYNSHAGNNISANDYFTAATGKGIIRWPHQRMPLRVYIHSGNGVVGYQPSFNQILRQSFKQWEIASQGQLRFTFVDIKGDPDIKCYWVDDPQSLSSLGEKGEALTEPVGKDIVSATIKILTLDRSKSAEHPDSQIPTEIRTVCLHEIGHAIGIQGHSSNPKDIMYLSETVLLDNPELSKRDIATTMRIYSSP